MTPLFHAVRLNDGALIKMLLRSKSISADAQNEAHQVRCRCRVAVATAAFLQTPLLALIAQHDKPSLSAISALIDGGAEPFDTDFSIDGLTALDLALWRRCWPAFEVLSKGGDAVSWQPGLSEHFVAGLRQKWSGGELTQQQRQQVFAFLDQQEMIAYKLAVLLKALGLFVGATASLEDVLAARRGAQAAAEAAVRDAGAAAATAGDSKAADASKPLFGDLSNSFPAVSSFPAESISDQVRWFGSVSISAPTACRMAGSCTGCVNLRFWQLRCGETLLLTRSP